jgi:hypothetical protein
MSDSAPLIPLAEFDRRERVAMRPKQPPRFTLRAFNEIKLSSSAPYLVKGLIPREGLIPIWGEAKCGKSFWTFDLMMHVALGWDYRGRRTHQGAVVYFVLEGEHGIAARAEAWRRAKLSEDTSEVPFFLVATRLDLVGDADALINDVRLQLAGNSCAAIVIDTLNRSIRGSESDDRDMGDYVKAADRVREAFGCAVVVIHHCGVNLDRPRGHTSLTGAADAQIAVRRDAAGRIVTALEYMKDGLEGAETVSELDVVEVGTDEDGEPITSCVIRQVEDAPATAKARGKPPSPNAKAFYDALVNALARAGESRPESSNRPSVTQEAWKAECLHLGLIGGEKKENAQRALLSKYRLELLAAHWIASAGKFVWQTKVAP